MQLQKRLKGTNKRNKLKYYWKKECKQWLCWCVIKDFWNSVVIAEDIGVN